MPQIRRYYYHSLSQLESIQQYSNECHNSSQKLTFEDRLTIELQKKGRLKIACVCVYITAQCLKQAQQLEHTSGYTTSQQVVEFDDWTVCKLGVFFASDDYHALAAKHEPVILSLQQHEDVLQ